jgi:hypothetical protein
MATLHEYFVKDGSDNLTTQQEWPIGDQAGTEFGKITARLHLDFNANAKYISFYFPDIPGVACPEVFGLNEIQNILAWTETTVGVTAGIGNDKHDARDLRFTGQVYLYSERPVSAPDRTRIITEASRIDHRLTFRSVEYMNERNKWEKPRAFISHDSRDKNLIAEPLAVQLHKFMCPVWYDQFSLKVGDSLRESIENGLKDSQKCIVVLTPNFLKNQGWSKREFDSIFTREIVEKQKVILPIWHDVSVEDVYQYSPILADRVAVQWSLGTEEVARKILAALT